jgi:hypothetical protein
MRYGVLAGFAVAVMTALAGLGAVNAQAATPASISAPAAGTIVFVRASTLDTSQNSAEDIITCKPAYSAPHISTHVPTEINSVGSVKCSHSMASIVIAIHLASNSFIQAPASDTCRNAGKATNSCQVNLPCNPNTTYGGGLSMSLTAPPGYEPPSASYSTSASFKVNGFC